MNLIDCPMLERDIVKMLALEAPQTLWRIKTEAWLIHDNDSYLLQQDGSIAPVEFDYLGDKFRYRVGECLWCLIGFRKNILKFRVLRYRTTLMLDLQIGVDDRLVDQLHKQQRIREPTIDAACRWLREEFF